MKLLNNLVNAKFLGVSINKDICYSPGPGFDALPPPTCDAGPLPPGCDCICHTPCDFGKIGKEYSNKEVIEQKVYEIN